MSYKELFRENNEQYTERIALVMERIGDIAVDGHNGTGSLPRIF